MRNLRIVAVIVVAVAALLLSSVPVLAQAEKTDFTGTWCRTAVYPGTTSSPGESGRIKLADQEAFFDVFTDDPRVTGEWHNYDVTANVAAAVPVSCPISANRVEGLVHAKFILTPSDSSISGTWEGWWKFSYTIEDGCSYAIMTANGNGTGDLEGLKIRVHAKHEFFNLNCSDLDANCWPYPLFNGYILKPSSSIHEENLEFMTEYFDAISWQLKPPEVYEHYIDCARDLALCEHIEYYETICPGYGLDPVKMVAIGNDGVDVLAEFRCSTPDEDPLYVALRYWIEGEKIVNHTMEILGP